MAISLLVRVVFVFSVLLSPIQSQAGFFSGILGDNAQAATLTGTVVQPSPTSANMALPQPTVSPSSVIEDKSTKKDPKKEDQIDENENINISDNALVSATSPMGATAGGIGSGDFSFEDISIYVVRSGDTVSMVADMFDVSVDTILSANDMKKGDKLKEGDVLLILPFSGVEHTVVKGQTLQGIANIYKVDIEEILLANDIDADAKIAVGEKLMIPGGTLSTVVVKSSGPAVPRNVPSQGSLKNAAGYFINPVPSARKSRGTSSTHKGVDLAAPTGTPIMAAAAGRVTFARNGYNGGFGNLVIISHPNGTETLYAHQSKISTTVGAQVTEGQLIGYVGNTGNSRGSHLHFEVHGAKNPGNDWSWKY